MKFPEKWYLKVTEDNDAEIRKWRTVKISCSLNHGYVLSKLGDKKGWHIFLKELNLYQHKGYVEITSEQFRKHVLNTEKVINVLRNI